MPKGLDGQGETPRQGVRIQRWLWALFADFTRRADPPSERPEVLRQFMAWYTWQPNARLPMRPPRPKATTRPAPEEQPCATR